MLAVRTAYVPLLRWVPPLLGLCIWWHLPSMPWAGMTSPTWVQEWSGSPVQSCTRVDSEMCSKEQKSACPPPSSCVYVWKTPEANISWKRLNHSVCSNSSCLKNPVWGKWDRPQRPGRNNHLSSYQFILLYLKCSQYKALGSDQYVRDCWSNYAKLLHSNGLLLLLLLSINTFFFFKSVFTLPLFSGHNFAVVPSDLSLGKGKMLLFKFYSFTLIIFCFKCLHWYICCRNNIRTMLYFLLLVRGLAQLSERGRRGESQKLDDSPDSSELESQLRFCSFGKTILPS